MAGFQVTIIGRFWVTTEVRHLTQRLGNSDRQSELLMQFGPRGQQHLLEILKVWGEIRPAVASHAYMPVIAS